MSYPQMIGTHGRVEAAGIVGGGPVVFITLGCVAVVLLALALILGRRK
jgi:hypothetical protein